LKGRSAIDECRIAALVLAMAAAAPLMTHGCGVSSGDLPHGNANDNGDSGNTNQNAGGDNDNADPDNENAGPDNENAREPVRAVLQVSNPTPSVNELVQLTCRVVDDGSGTPTDVERYEFFGQTDRLVIDERSGAARFVVSESDVNTSLEFSCRAILASGEVSQTSQPAIVTIGE